MTSAERSKRVAERSARIGQLVEMAKAATPGPWTVALGSGNNACTLVRHEDTNGVSTPIADVAPDWFLGEQQERMATIHQERANIKLIAAAPEMASLLQEYEEENAALRQDRDMWKGECASISTEFGLPPTIRPMEGEIARMMALAAQGALLARAVELLRKWGLAFNYSGPHPRDDTRAFLAEYDAAQARKETDNAEG